MRIIKSGVSLLLMMMILLTGSVTVPAAAESAVDVAVDDTAAYILKTVKDPKVGSIGGEWAVIGLTRSGCDVPQSWYNTYYKNLTAYVQEKNGILHDKKYTDYSRVILALTAIGKDPTNVGGYNLLEKLGDYNKVIWQGINGPIFALIALDSGNYEIPMCEGAEVRTTRELLINKITSQQLSDGGFSLDGESADPDITAMALQALAPYKNHNGIKMVIDKAIDCLSKLQNSNGGYSSYGAANSESVVQVIVALTALDIDTKKDIRFIKNGDSVIDNLMTFYVSGGGFKHVADNSSPNGMATEQGFYGLVAYERFGDEKNRLYDMSDATDFHSVQRDTLVGLPNKNTDVKETSIIYPDKTFSDISGNTAQKAIKSLASRGIISGVSDTTFEPNHSMSRAEFAAIVVRTLGLTPAANNAFSDVAVSSWYSGYIGTANNYGIVTGTSKTEFSPEETITREQAAVMVSRAAKLCGIDIDMSESEIRDMLAQFSDYITSSSWARASLAFCYKNDILAQRVLNIEPQKAVTRAEIAAMIYTMLQKAELV